MQHNPDPRDRVPRKRKRGGARQIRRPVSWTEDEYAYVAREARAHGRDTAVFIRETVLGRPIRRGAAMRADELIRELVWVMGIVTELRDGAHAHGLGTEAAAYASLLPQIEARIRQIGSSAGDET